MSSDAAQLPSALRSASTAADLAAVEDALEVIERVARAALGGRAPHALPSLQRIEQVAGAALRTLRRGRG